MATAGMLSSNNPEDPENRTVQVPFELKIELKVTLPIIGAITLPFSFSGNIPIPLPFLSSSLAPDVDIAKLTLTTSVPELCLVLENRNDVNLVLKDLKCEICLSDSDVSIGNANLAHTSIELGKNKMAVVDIPVTLSNNEFASALDDVIHGKATGYIKGTMTVDTPAGPIMFPITKELTLP